MTRSKGYFFIVLASLLWGSMGVAAKHLFDLGITPQELVQARLTISVVMLVLFWAFKDKSVLKISSGDIIPLFLLGGLGIALNYFSYFFAISKISVASAILLQYFGPSLIALYSVLILKEKFTTNMKFAIILTLLGCFFVTGAYSTSFEDLNIAGILAGCVAAISYALYTLGSETLMKKMRASTVQIYAFLFAAIIWNVSYPPLSFLGNYLAPSTWLLYVWVGVMGTIIPFALFLSGVALIRSTRAAVMSTLEPIFAAFMAFIFLNEKLDIYQIGGVIIVVAAIVILNLKRVPSRSLFLWYFLPKVRRKN